MPKRSLGLNAILNAIKQCCQILFPLITFPYISRILGNEGYGKYCFSYSITSYFILLAALGINTYGIREGAKIREDKVAIQEFASQIFSINILSVIVSYIIFFFTILLSVKIRVYANLILIQSFLMILSAVGADWINNIYEDFAYITLRYIGLQFLSLVLMLTFVRSSNDIVTYCIITLIASGGGNLLNIFYIRKYVHLKFTKRMNIKKHIAPLLILFINSVAITVYVNADITMLGFYYDDGIVGIYSLASKIYNILKQLVYAVIVVSLPRIAYVLNNKKEMYTMYINKICWALSILLFPFVAGVVVMNKTIIEVVGGKDYISGSTALCILGFALIVAIFSGLITNCVLIVNGQERQCLKATVASAMVNVILNVILLPRLGMAGAASTTLIAEFINCAVQMWYSKRYFNWKSINARPIKISIMGSLLIVPVCVVCNFVVANIFVRICVAVIVSGLVYMAVLVVLKHELVVEIFAKFKNKVKE